MSNAIYKVPEPYNEPAYSYGPGSVERRLLKEELRRQEGMKVEIPMIIGGREVRSGDMGACVAPHRHRHVLGRFHRGGAEHFREAIAAALEAGRDWSAMPWEARAAIFLKAADLLATSHRLSLNAATMLGQSKVVLQAEIDSACELIDFFRFNAYYMMRLCAEQPLTPSHTFLWNATEARPLEGFVFAVTPFNFTSIAGNLPCAPAIMGNTVVWKPASTSVLAASGIMKLLEDAGLPPGVINMVPAPGPAAGQAVLGHRDLAGVHFTGSTPTFQSMWRTVGENIRGYRAYPRLVGETGGKNFVFVHVSADPDALCAAVIRGAFEYQGQKCSAASRMYVPESLWKGVRDRLLDDMGTIRMGDVTDFRNFMGAVIDKPSFENVRGYIDRAKRSPDVEVLSGGNCDDTEGYFIEPAAFLVRRPDYESMVDEIFGPVLSIFVYPDAKYEETLELCDATSSYGLTGSIFARDRRAILTACDKLRFAAGNFYINDKPTGAVVGQQPFGGGRASGTNDKAGGILNLVRWISARAIKENFEPPREYRYPSMGDG